LRVVREVLNLTPSARSKDRTKRRGSVRGRFQQIQQQADRVRLFCFDDSNASPFVRKRAPHEDDLRVDTADGLSICEQVGKNQFVLAADGEGHETLFLLFEGLEQTVCLVDERFDALRRGVGGRTSHRGANHEKGDGDGNPRDADP